MPLVWKRIQDGEHNNGRPFYEYEAVSNGIKYYIVNSTDGGFGLSISYADGSGKPPGEYGYGIKWYRTLKRCKDMSELDHATRPDQQ